MSKTTIRGEGFTLEIEHKDKTIAEVLEEIISDFRAQNSLLKGENRMLRDRIKELEEQVMLLREETSQVEYKPSPIDIEIAKATEEARSKTPKGFRS